MSLKLPDPWTTSWLQHCLNINTTGMMTCSYSSDPLSVKKGHGQIVRGNVVNEVKCSENCLLFDPHTLFLSPILSSNYLLADVTLHKYLHSYQYLQINTQSPRNTMEGCRFALCILFLGKPDSTNMMLCRLFMLPRPLIFPQIIDKTTGRGIYRPKFSKQWGLFELKQNRGRLKY